jgi:cytochrome b561
MFLFAGVVMGYYGGRGLPFFFTTIPGAKPAVPSIAKPAYEWHKLAGQVLEIMIPVHVLGSAFHVVKGQKIFARMNPLTQ